MGNITIGCSNRLDPVYSNFVTSSICAPVRGRNSRNLIRIVQYLYPSGTFAPHIGTLHLGITTETGTPTTLDKRKHCQGVASSLYAELRGRDLAAFQVATLYYRRGTCRVTIAERPPNRTKYPD